MSKLKRTFMVELKVEFDCSPDAMGISEEEFEECRKHYEKIIKLKTRAKITKAINNGFRDSDRFFDEDFQDGLQFPIVSSVKEVIG